MRISDWSSDVCSSDLFTLPDDAVADGTLTVTVGLTTQSEAHPLPLGKIRVFVFEDNAWTNAAPDFGEPGLEGFREIGRASGRERVCTYVWTWVVAVTLQTKNELSHTRTTTHDK